MSSIDLNIVDRGLDGQQWTHERGKITVGDLDRVTEQRVDSSGALNSLPTPFARFFIFKEAFRRLTEERKNPNKEAGTAYQQLVSDCLDVFEILFESKYHKNQWEGKKEIIVKEWNPQNDLTRLAKDVPILGESIKSYYKNDIHLDKLYFIIYKDENGKEFLLGTSSPFTGFITPPNLDKKESKGTKQEISFFGRQYNDLKIPRKSLTGRDKSYYFRETLLFENRSTEFRNYIHSLIEANSQSDDLKYIREYIKSFSSDGEINPNAQQNLKLRPIQSLEGNDLVINGLEIQSNNDISTCKIFADHIVRLPYKISSDNFYLPQGDRKCDYLLPFTKEALQLLPLENIHSATSIKEVSNGAKVEFSLQIEDKEYKQTYEKESPSSGHGRIIDLKQPYNVNLELGIFPNIKSSDQSNNNYFKVMLVTRDNDSKDRFDIEKTNCRFYRKNKNGYQEIEETNGSSYTYGVYSPIIRSKQNKESACSSKFYEIFKTDFSAIEMQLSIENGIFSGFIFPKFKNEKKSDNAVTYAIDFGTSNTYISKRENGANMHPIQLKMNETMMSMLHEKKSHNQKQDIYLWEDMPFKEAEDYFRSEFVPPYIDGDIYKFPLRTAMCCSTSNSKDEKLFSTHNIAFSYGKRRIVGNNEVITSLKWDESRNKEARLFIRELLLLVKCDALLNDVDANNISLIWFSPLSLKNNVKTTFEDIWKDEAGKIGISEDKIWNYSESEAPYHYYHAQDKFNAIESVALIDIGGGSTDIVCFENGKPKFANSIHFGCDLIWGNGFSKFSDDKENGIYKYYKEKIFFDDKRIQEINNEMINSNSPYSSAEIINFWISNNEKTKIKEKDIRFTQSLKTECKPIFIYHYAAIIYYLGNLIKSQKLTCPRALAFSGNGSYYIDRIISSNEVTITEITKEILKKIFGQDIKEIQIILPSSRKESTCYGGLYRNRNAENPKTIIYQGAKSYCDNNINEIQKAFTNGNMRKDILENVNNFSKCYKEILSMVLEKENITTIDTNYINDILSQGIEDALERNYTNNIENRSNNAIFNQSLFFFPIIDKLKDLANISTYLQE